MVSGDYACAGHCAASGDRFGELEDVQVLLRVEVFAPEVGDGTLFHTVTAILEDIFALLDRFVPVLLPHGHLGLDMLGDRPGHASVFVSLGGVSGRLPVKCSHGVVQVFIDRFENFFRGSRGEYPFQVVHRRGFQVEIQPVETAVQVEVHSSPEQFGFAPGLFDDGVFQSEPFRSGDDFVGFADNIVPVGPECEDQFVGRFEVRTAELHAASRTAYHDVGRGVEHQGRKQSRIGGLEDGPFQIVEGDGCAAQSVGGVEDIVRTYLYLVVFHQHVGAGRKD